MLLVGTSGWQYRDWRGRFYPGALPQRRWLEHYAERFATVEVNNTFYRLPERTVFEGWRAGTPEDFVVGVKVSRYLSHVRRLRDPEEPVRRLLERASGLEAKLGPALLQLPPTLRADLGLLGEVLARWPSSVRLAFEPRHDSWSTDAMADLLHDHDVALVLADRRSRLLGPAWATASWGYVRFHEGRATPAPCYGDRALATWADRLGDLYGPEADVYAYFNNDPGACAVHDARRFAAAARRVGLVPTRVPVAGDVRAG